MIVFLIFLGLAFGSFLNVLVWRLNDPKAPPFWQGRSVCPQCRRQLKWQDNIPLFSYVFLRGKCRYCRRPISLQYPIVELTTAVAFVLIGFNPVVWGLAAGLIVIFFSDLIYGFIPDEMLVAIGFLKLIENFKLENKNWGTDLIAGLSALTLFYLIYKTTRERGLGFGDVKLAFIMGFLLGWPNILVALWVGFVSGGVVAVILLALRKTKFSATIALGPFLVIGTVFAALWSDNFLKLLGIP